jgi:hypothetical protein
MYLFIPVEMCSWAIRNKFIRPFQLYIHLKGSCSGKRKISKDDFKRIATDLSLKSYKSVENNLKLLLKRNWIGYSNNSGYYFIRGFDVIRKTHNLRFRSAARFDTDEILKFKAFIAGAVIGHLVNIQRRKRRVTERKRSRSKQVIPPSSEYFPVSCLSVAKILNISISTAHRLKNFARKANYIDLKKNLTPIPVNIKYLKQYKKANEEFAHKIIVRKRKPYIQEIDTALPKIYFKRRKKIETSIGATPRFFCFFFAFFYEV